MNEITNKFTSNNRYISHTMDDKGNVITRINTVRHWSAIVTRTTEGRSAGFPRVVKDKCDNSLSLFVGLLGLPAKKTKHVNERLPLMENRNSFLAKLLNGAIAGVVGVSCVFPLDLCKTRLQNQLNGGPKLYKNFHDVLFQVVRTEGPRGLYKGLGVNVVLINPEKAIKLAVNDQLRQMFGGRMHILPLHLEMLAGGVAGFCQVAITTPMEMLKIQLQMAGNQAGNKQVNSSISGSSTAAATSVHVRSFGTASMSAQTSAIQLAKDLIQTKGISGIYRGLGATFIRDVPFSCIYFPLFAYLNLRGVDATGGRPPLMYSLGAGCLAGLTSSLAVNPCDVIKTRLQLLNRPQGQPSYNGIIDCACKIYTNEGFLAFYKGAIPRMIVIAPLFGIAQTVYFVGVAEWMLGVERETS